MSKANSFQIAKVQPQNVAWLLLNFLLILVWSSFKSVASITNYAVENKRSEHEYTKKPGLVKFL